MTPAGRRESRLPRSRRIALASALALSLAGPCRAPSRAPSGGRPEHPRHSRRANGARARPFLCPVPAPRLSRRTVMGVRLAIVRGGWPQTCYSGAPERLPLLAHRAGAEAGVDGTFFAADGLFGPRISLPDRRFHPDRSGRRARLLTRRPLVLWNRTHILFTPYDDGLNDLRAVQARLPGCRSVFLAGAWLVRDGRGLPAAEMARGAAPDAFQVRPRAFFALSRRGEAMIGISFDGVDSVRLGRILASVGAGDAVLLDSGNSTALLFGGRRVEAGHGALRQPPRPVPHAVVLYASPEDAEQPPR